MGSPEAFGTARLHRALRAGVGLAALAAAACSTLKAGRDGPDDASNGALDATSDGLTPPPPIPDPEPPTDAGPIDSAPVDAGPVDAGADAQAGAVNLTMSAACAVNWSTAVFQGPPQVATSMSAIVPATNERVTLIRKTSKSEVQLSSSEQRANGDIVEIYARGQLFRNSCNVVTGPCAYMPGSMTYTSDPITGTLKVNRYDVASGELDLELANVVLQSVTTADYCTVSGRVRAAR